MIDKHVHQHASLVYMSDNPVGAFYGIKGLVDLFTKEEPGIDDPKSLTAKELPMIAN